jgi:capsular polysaccharide biosynthesis protein
MEFKEYFKMIKKRLWLVILCVVISGITTSLYSKSNYVPIYFASTKLIVNSTVAEDQSGIGEKMDIGAVNANIGLIETYKEIIKSPAIMNKVVQQHPDLNVTPEKLMSDVQISTLNNTQIMTIGIPDPSYELAADIVNAVAQTVKSEIPRIMKVNNVEILNIADLNDIPPPVNKKSNSLIVISIAVSLMLSIGIIFLLEFLDDTLKTEQDIKTVLGFTTFSLIPTVNRREMKRLQKKKVRKKAGDVQAYVTNTAQ